MKETPKTMQTVSLIGTDEELKALWGALGDAGWRLKFNGHSGSWLGEPVYTISKSVIKDRVLADIIETLEFYASQWRHDVYEGPSEELLKDQGQKALSILKRLERK